MAEANKITHLDQLLSALECSIAKLCDKFSPLISMCFNLYVLLHT